MRQTKRINFEGMQIQERYWQESPRRSQRLGLRLPFRQEEVMLPFIFEERFCLLL